MVKNMTTKVNITNYDFGKTLKKIIIDLLIWGLPMLATFVIAQLGTTAELTIGGLIGICVKTIVDWLKHR